jgi:hypothetical protein
MYVLVAWRLLFEEMSRSPIRSSAVASALDTTAAAVNLLPTGAWRL